VRSADTSVEAHQVQLAVWRRMTPAERVAAGAESSENAVRMALDGIRRRHPDYDDETVHRAFLRLRLGDDLCREVWPDTPLVAP
jgi:hypothetical protein